MPMLDIVEWDNAGADEMVHRVPEGGSGEFRLGSQLVVREFQTALFFNNGQARDRFGPGRYTLSTDNIPILTSILSIPFGSKSPFRTEVYFISLRTFIDQKWGTPQPVALRDPDLGVARLRAFGTFSMQIADPTLMVNRLVAGQGLYTTDDMIGYLRNIIASRFADQLGELKVGLFDLPSHYDDLGAMLAAKVRDDFAGVGLDLRTMFVTNISTTDETQKAIDERASMGAIGDMGKYMQFKAAQGFGAGDGGAAGGAAATGMGMGAGVGMGAMMAQAMMAAMQQPPAGATTTAASGTPAAPPSLDMVFGSLTGVVNSQLSVPEAERTELIGAVDALRGELAAPTPDLARIREHRGVITTRWPWMTEPLATAFAQPAVGAVLAAAATGYLDQPAAGA